MGTVFDLLIQTDNNNELLNGQMGCKVGGFRAQPYDPDMKQVADTGSNRNQAQSQSQE